MKVEQTLYAGEAQLAGWSDTHTGGPKLTLWLPSSDDLDKFRALTMRKGNTAGHRVMLAIVEIGEQEEPVPPPAPVKSAEPRKRTGPMCLEAVSYCESAAFQHWVAEQMDEGQLKGAYLNYSGEALAKVFILDECGVISRKELDTHEEAKLAFINLIRMPFMRWMREQQGDDHESRED